MSPLPVVRKEVEEIVARIVQQQADALGKEAVFVRYAAGKVHSSHKTVLAGGWRSQLALRGWHFGAVRCGRRCAC